MHGTGSRHPTRGSNDYEIGVRKLPEARQRDMAITPATDSPQEVHAMAPSMEIT